MGIARDVLKMCLAAKYTGKAFFLYLESPRPMAFDDSFISLAER